MDWLIVLGVLALLAFLPLGISARYDLHGPLVLLIAGPVRIRLYPKRRKEPTTSDKTEKKTSGKKRAQAAKKGGSIEQFRPLLNTLFALLKQLKSKLRVNRLELNVVLAADDPCDLAINYGKAWAALGDLIPLLESFFMIKKRKLEVQCDFTSDKTLIFARADITLTLGRLVVLVLVYGVRLLRQYLQIMKLRKGGAPI